MNTEDTIMEGHMHDHGLVYTSVPFLVFDEGGCVFFLGFHELARNLGFFFAW